MSLNRMALRIATVLALRGNTAAGMRVWDSRIGEIDELARDQAEPFIIVHVDDEDATSDGPALRKGQRRVTLVIEAAIGILRSDAGAGWQLMTPETDAQLELALDALETQIFDALQAVESEARELWAQLALTVHSISIRRGSWSEEDRSRRYAARLIEMQIGIPRDAQPGTTAPGEMTPLLAQLVVLMEQQPDMQQLAGAVRDLAGRVSGGTRRGRLAALIGASKAAAEAMQLSPDVTDDHTFAGDPLPPDAQPQFPPGDWTP